jgi:hypothetical protein
MGIGLKVSINMVLIVVTIVLGFILHRSGKPYNNLLFTFHKLVTLGFIIFIAFILAEYSNANGLSNLLLTFLLLAVLSTIALFVSGTMLSLEKKLEAMLQVHRISTVGFLVCASVIFFHFVTKL